MAINRRVLTRGLEQRTMTELLSISKTVQLPLEAVTSTFGLLAVRGAGKTNAMRTMAEEMYEASLPFVVIDPVGSWYGLRAGRDGSAPGGLPIFIFGGEHGDVPLTRGSGELVADVIVSQRLSAILDLSGFDSESDRKAFLLSFACRIYKKNRDPIHLFLEEADDYIPQRPMRDELHLKRAWENIVRRGRGRGIGITIATQRSAVVNKDVLTQVETLFVMRTTGPQDIEAIKAWTKYHSFGETLLPTLSGLADGEAWVWSPHFLKKTERFKFRLSGTFDSGATPKNLKGKSARKVANLADVDIDKLKGRIAETIEVSKQEDPKVLRAALRATERELLKARGELEELQLERRRQKEHPPVNLQELNTLIEKLSAASAQTEETLNRLWDVKAAVASGELPVARAKAGPETSAPKALSPQHKLAGFDPSARTPLKKQHQLPTLSTEASKGLTACARAMLAVLASRHPESTTDAQLSILTGYSIKSSGFDNSLSSLRTRSLIEGPRGALSITLGGQKVAGKVEALPKGKALLEYWCSKLQKCERTLLVVIYDAGKMPGGGCAVGKDYIAEHSGYSQTSSGFDNALSRLRTLELIVGYKEMKAADIFYD